jgi:hypothetical protein
MNIRSKILGGGNPAEERILRSKTPKGADLESLDNLIEREQARTKHDRFEDRHRLQGEKVEVRKGRTSHSVELINLSGGGAMIAGGARLQLWDKVELSLGENGTVECAVRWVRGDRYGLEFAHETRIDCGADEQAAVLREVIRRSFPDLKFEADAASQEQHSGPDGRGERRHPLVWSGLLHHDYQSSPVRLRNISSSGTLIECPEYLTVGSEPLLELGPDVSIPSTVAWVVGDQAGLRFNRPFDLRDLARTRPNLAGSNWQPPAYLEGAEPGSGEHWGQMSLGQLRDELEGFLKR